MSASPINMPIPVRASHLIIMGVSGCGKTTLGKSLADELGWHFFDADEFHPASNIAKMKAGIPLSDADRTPWLWQLNALLQTNPQAVLACSALKQSYREILSYQLPQVRFIHPHGTFQVILDRIKKRSLETGHYMPAALLQSQFDTLEPCLNALMIDIQMPRSQRVAWVIEQLCQVKV